MDIPTDPAMSRRPLLAFLHAAPARDPVPDADLLRRFADRRDEAAFELLVRRHADAVWAVCRGALRHDADAEDAFQATFLALARKPGAVRTACVVGWLHRVAVHAALKLRAKRVRAGEPLPDDVAAADRSPFADAAIVHEELAALPDRYRLPVVLCDLEGHTHAEAAAALGWPVGTVSGRLSRARDRLRGRLVRRGLAGAAVGAAAGPVPGALVRSAAAVGAGAVPSAEVITLTNGVLFAMNATKLTRVAAVTVAAVGLTVGTVWAVGFQDTAALTAPAVAADPPKGNPPVAESPAAKPKDKPVAGAKERALSLRNLRAVAQAIQMYHLEHGYLPTDIVDKKTGKPLLSWRVAILPYMEQRALYTKFKLDEPWDSESNRPWGHIMVKVYSAGIYPQPGPDGYGLTVVKRFTGPETLHQPGKTIDVSKTPDGRSNTLLLAEVGDPIPWTKPADPVVVQSDPDKGVFTPKDPPAWAGPFKNVVNVAFADGVALSLKPDLRQEWVWSMAYWNDALVIPDRGEMTAYPSPAQDAEDVTALLRVTKQMADQFVKLSEEEVKLRAELAKKAMRPADTAAPLADRLIEFAQQLNQLQHQVIELRKQAEQPKK